MRSGWNDTGHLNQEARVTKGEEPKNVTTLEVVELSSPLGTLIAVVRDSAICSMTFANDWPRARRRLKQWFDEIQFKDSTHPSVICEPVDAYFDGELDALDSISVDRVGTTFQSEVWAALRKIPAGSTATYGEVAHRIGNPKAARAVGRAASQNPIGIVVPCHRVICADGSISGYKWGASRKRWLLKHEGALLLS